MPEINIEVEKARVRQELQALQAQLVQLEQQRQLLIQEIFGRQGVLAFLDSLDQHREREAKG